MTSKSWKKVEGAHSKLLGCNGRVGPTGLDLPDSFSHCLAVESKSKGTVPDWLLEAMQQSEDNAERLALKQGEGLPHQRLPIVVVHQDGDTYLHDLVIVRMDEFLTRLLPILQAGVRVIDGEVTQRWRPRS